MSKYFAGIEPLEKGYEVISIKPQFGKLKQISSRVTTVKGEISLEAQKSETSILINLKVPTKTCVAIPKISADFEIKVEGKTIYQNGKTIRNQVAKFDREDEKYVYFYVEKGEYQWKAETR